ncbi:uncharacterized protein ACRADG_008447 [Cochliomyia hominivorax]
MNSNNLNENTCLICLEHEGFFEWTKTIFEFSGPSYKDCYYLFTQLQEEEDEELMQMFCLDCGNNLRNGFELIDKALSVWDTQTDDKQCRICLKSDTFFEGTEVIFEFYGPSYNDCYYKYTQLQEHENSCRQIYCLNCGNGLRNIHLLVEQACKADNICKQIQQEVEIKYEIERVTSPEKELDNLLGAEQNGLREILILDKEDETKVHNQNEENIIESDYMYELDNNKSSISSKDIQEATENKSQTKPKERRRPLMCSYCSKIFYSRNHFTKHEETHQQRERTEACPICGLKFYNAIGVKHHLTVHNENRERKYKCEHCPKAFYSCGGLNCHRRKHLDNWLQCKLCPKKYCREYELNRHMRTHDAAPVTKDDLGTKSKQQISYKKCETCGKKVNKYNWESHMAKHLNQPLVQCGICNNSYFERLTLCRHLQKEHDVKKTEYDKYVIKLNSKFKPRYSNLMKKQNIAMD